MLLCGCGVRATWKIITLTSGWSRPPLSCSCVGRPRDNSPTWQGATTYHSRLLLLRRRGYINQPPRSCSRTDLTVPGGSCSPPPLFRLVGRGVTLKYAVNGKNALDELRLQEDPAFLGGDPALSDLNVPPAFAKFYWRNTQRTSTRSLLRSW